MAQTTNLKPVIQIMEFDRCLKYEPCEQNDVYFGCVEKSWILFYKITSLDAI